jgi:hypothetical protein
VNCGRCEGLMLEDDFIDMKESCEGMWLRAWRCLNCGHATDSVMVVNRQLHALRLASQVEHNIVQSWGLICHMKEGRRGCG